MNKLAPNSKALGMVTRWLEATLLHPRHGYAWAIGIGMLVALPTLVFGMFLDDFIHYLTLLGEHPFVGPMDTFSFSDGSPETAYAIMDTGPFPWSLDPEFKARFGHEQLEINYINTCSLVR